MMGSEFIMFLILNFFFKKNLTTLCSYNDSLKHNKFIQIITKPVQPLKFTDFFYLKDRFSIYKLWVHTTCHNSMSISSWNSAYIYI
jgi:hypothetical protein